jgi:protein ImuA
VFFFKTALDPLRYICTVSKGASIKRGEMNPVFKPNLSRGDLMSQRDSRCQLVERLRQRLGHWQATPADEATVFSCGAAAVDRLLPGGGLRHGMLVEWLSASGRSGAATLGLLSAREACREGGVLVVIDRSQTFYPPAAAAWGIDLERLIVVRPRNARDELWAAVQALRSPVVAALWARIDRLDSRAFRRLQLAAETGRTLGVLVRPASARGQPSWADVRLEVESRATTQESRARIPTLDSRLLTLGSIRRVQVQVLRVHGGRPTGSAMLEIDDTAYTIREANLTYDANPLPVVIELADSAGRSQPARA